MSRTVSDVKIPEKGRRKAKGKRGKDIKPSGGTRDGAFIINDVRNTIDDMNDVRFAHWFSDDDHYSSQESQPLNVDSPNLKKLLVNIERGVYTKAQVRQAFVDLLGDRPNKIGFKETPVKVEPEAPKQVESKKPKDLKKKRAPKSKPQPKESKKQETPKPATESKNDVANKKSSCRYGDHCRDDKCDKYHTTAKCRDGAGCKRIGGCYFYHPGVVKTSCGQPLISRVAKALNTKPNVEQVDKVAEMLNGRKQFVMSVPTRVTFPIYLRQSSAMHTSHGIYFAGQFHMTKHGLDAFNDEKLQEVNFQTPSGQWGVIPVDKFKYCAPDVVYAPMPESVRPQVRVKYRTPVPADFGNVLAVRPELATARGVVVSIDSPMEHYRYSVPTKPGDSGCGIWSDDGELLGIHTDGSRTTNGGTIISKRWVLAVTGSKEATDCLKY